MKKITLSILLFFSLFLVSCKKNQTFDIVTTSYFQYDIVNNIVVDKLSVDVLTKPGVDSHDFLPTSRQMSNIKNSSLFIFTSYEMDSWLNNNEQSVIGSNTNVINLSNHLNNTTDDLHYWTDPVLILSFINIIKDEIIKIDPFNKDFYLENANNYYHKISNVHKDLENLLSNYDNVKLYFAGHNALKPFEERYNIEIVALSNTSKPDADLTISQIITLVDLIKENNVKYLFIEELKEPKVANKIKEELAKDNYDLTLLVLHGYHNISKDDAKNNTTYYDLLLNNYQNIKMALGDLNGNY
mgnify:CR=1 FL=1